MSSVEVPHFDLPFRFQFGRVAVVEQDTPDDIMNCVEAILRTPEGFRDEVPDFGSPDLAMRRTPIGADFINEILTPQEPRAEFVIRENIDKYDQLLDRINIGVKSKGST